MSILGAQRTMYGISLAMSVMLGKAYNVLSNTTLNEKHDILSGVAIPSGTYPTLKYIGIGVGGLGIMGSSTGYSYSKHSPMDYCLFDQVPFVVRELTSDLTAVEKARYRLRKVVIIENTEYACYYLKLLDNINYRDDLFKISSINNLNTLSIYSTETDAHINPTPKIRGNGITNISSSEYVVKSAKIDFAMSDDEIVDFQHVLDIFKKTNTRITEICLCSGVDVASDLITEAVGAQILYHVDVNIDITASINSNTGFVKAIEIGGSEPMIL